MPYCKNCGAKLEESAKFCPSCGLSVTGRITEGRVIERRPGRFLAFFLIAILLAAILFGFLVFLPIRSINTQETRTVQLQAGIQSVEVDLSVNIGDVNVAFRDLSGDAVRLDLSVSGFGGYLWTQPYTLTSQDEKSGNILSVMYKVDSSVLQSLWNLAFLKTKCDLYIDPSLNATIIVHTNTGKISFETRNGVVVNALTLETITGAVDASFAEGTIITRDISVTTTTGAVSFSWQNLVVERDVAIDLRSTTGATSVSIVQEERLQKKVDLGVEVTTGAISLIVIIRGNVSADITSSTTTGLIDVQRTDGFSGSSSHLHSNNYPSSERFDISLQTTTGAIGIDVQHA